MIRYRWRGSELQFWEHDTITITDRAGIPGKRDHARVYLLEHPQVAELVPAFLDLVPPERRLTDGTIGFNLFRTYTKVVTSPHRDHEEFIIIYVLERVGDGAMTYLYRTDDVSGQGVPTAEPVLMRQLNPGEIIIFEDKCFMHGATPLQHPHGGTTMRDVLLCTVDYPETYLSSGA